MFVHNLFDDALKLYILLIVYASYFFFTVHFYHNGFVVFLCQLVYLHHDAELECNAQVWFDVIWPISFLQSLEKSLHTPILCDAGEKLLISSLLTFLVMHSPIFQELVETLLDCSQEKLYYWHFLFESDKANFLAESCNDIPSINFF